MGLLEKLRRLIRRDRQAREEDARPFTESRDRLLDAKVAGYESPVPPGYLPKGYDEGRPRH